MVIRGWVLAMWIVVALGAVLWLLYRTKVGELFHQHVADRPKRRAVLAAIGFFVTFAVARLMAYGAYRNVGPFQYVYVGQTHIHHLVWGILLLLAVGFCWLMEVGTGARASSLLASRLMSLLFGVGAALTLDEFALWLHLQEGIYWTRRDLVSLDAVVLFGAALLIGIWGRDFLKAVGLEMWEARPKRRRRKHNVPERRNA
jgi:hypothetical protein